MTIAQVTGTGLMLSAVNLALAWPAWLSARSWPLLGLLLAVIFAFGITRVLRKVVVPALRRKADAPFVQSDDNLLDTLAAPLRALVLVAVTHATVSLMDFAPSFRQAWRATFWRLLIVLATWLCIRIVRVFAGLANRHLEHVGRPDSTAFVLLVQRTISGIAVFLAFALLLRSAGFNVTAMLAGLGVGGLALAFAAQKTLENLFAGVSIVLDKPIRIGDVCSVGAYKGKVEDIGLRSTRLRTADRTVVTVPNGQLSTMNVENEGMRDKCWFHHILNVRLDATPDQLDHLLESLTQLLEAHKMVEASSARARFTRLRPESMEIELVAYVLTTNGEQFLSAQQELLLGALRAIEASGTALAIPIHEAILHTDYFGAQNAAATPYAPAIRARKTS
jgi:MscS family membrane protein